MILTRHNKYYTGRWRIPGSLHKKKNPLLSTGEGLTLIMITINNSKIMMMMMTTMQTASKARLELADDHIAHLAYSRSEHAARTRPELGAVGAEARGARGAAAQRCERQCLAGKSA